VTASLGAACTDQLVKDLPKFEADLLSGMRSNEVTLPDKFLERIAQDAVLAPSGDNLQPWKFEASHGSLRLIHDPNRDHSLFNVQHLASYIALGAVLENVCVVATKYNHRADICYFPEARKQDVIAQITFAHGVDVDPLADWIERRCTNRRPYETRSLDRAVIAALDLPSNRSLGTDLLWIHEKPALKRLGAIVSSADRLLFGNPVIHHHFFSTLRWNQAEIEQTRDGLPIGSLELGSLGSFAFRCLKNWSAVKFLNRFGLSKATANHSTLLMRRCSAAGLITAPNMSPLGFLQAGRTFQRVWLQATKESLALQPMTAVIFLQLKSRLGDYEGLADDEIALIEQLRQNLAEFFELPKGRVPAMLFRLGYGAPVSAKTLRRSALD